MWGNCRCKKYPLAEEVRKGQYTIPAVPPAGADMEAGKSFRLATILRKMRPRNTGPPLIRVRTFGSIFKHHSSYRTASSSIRNPTTMFKSNKHRIGFDDAPITLAATALLRRSGAEPETGH